MCYKVLCVRKFQPGTNEWIEKILLNQSVNKKNKLATKIVGFNQSQKIH